MTTENRRKKLAAKFLVPFIGKRKVDKIRTAITVIGLIAIIVFIGACQLGLEGDTGGSTGKGSSTTGGDTTGGNLEDGGDITGGQFDVPVKERRSVTYYRYDVDGNLTIKEEVVEEPVFPEVTKEKAEAYAVARAARGVTFGEGDDTDETSFSATKRGYYERTIKAMTDAVNAAVTAKVADIGGLKATYRYVKKIPLYNSLGGDGDTTGPVVAYVGWDLDSYNASPAINIKQAREAIDGQSYTGTLYARFPSSFTNADPSSPEYLDFEWTGISWTSMNYDDIIDQWREYTYYRQLRIAYRYQYQFRGLLSALTAIPNELSDSPAARKFVTYENKWNLGNGRPILPLLQDPSIFGGGTSYLASSDLRTDIEGLTGNDAPRSWFLESDGTGGVYGSLLTAIGYPNADDWIELGGPDNGKPVLGKYDDIGKKYYITLNELLWRGDLPDAVDGQAKTIVGWGE